MSITPPASSAIASRYGMPLFCALIAAGLAGNYLNYPIFLNVDFVFGSIFAMLALQFFGLGMGIVAAAIMGLLVWLVSVAGTPTAKAQVLGGGNDYMLLTGEVAGGFDALVDVNGPDQRLESVG